VATFAPATLPLGGQSLTAAYSGNTNFISSASTAVLENVLTPEFSIASSTPEQTVVPTQSVDYTISLTPLNPTFVYPVKLSASGLPSGVTATFNPSSIATGAGTTSTIMTLSASAQARGGDRIHLFGRLAVPTALALLMLPLTFNRRASKTSRQLSRAGKAWLALLVLVGLSALGGCGGHPVQRSTVTVTAVCGPVTHTINVTLTLQ
jgi:hypothetical protein